MTPQDEVDTDHYVADNSTETDNTAYTVELDTDTVTIKTTVEATSREGATERAVEKLTKNNKNTIYHDSTRLTTHTRIAGASVQLTIDTDELVAYPEKDNEQGRSGRTTRPTTEDVTTNEC